GLFDKESAPKLLPYQTGEGQFYENGEDIHYGYSKLSPDELEIAPRQYPVPEIVSFLQIPQGNFAIFASYNFQCNEHPMSHQQLFPQIEPSLLTYGQVECPGLSLLTY
ncbi:5677_t:CDS:2, partial [Gigaspora margarita]